MTKVQEPIVENYLKTAYIPALHRAGISNVGVFKPVTADPLEQRIYVFIPFTSLDKFDKINQTLVNDQQYKTAGKEYLEAPSNSPAYTRVESILMRSFPGMPQPETPKLTAPKNERIYELRSYEGATENLSANKIKQFNIGNAANGGEIKIFKNLNFNAIFYAEVLAGSKMPNLMYMTTFNSKPDRDAHWTAFNTDKDWGVLRGLPEYQRNVSKNETTFLYPVEYSEY